MRTLLDEEGWITRDSMGPKIVALGGGHGLSVTLRALRHITKQLTAVVTVADDGGSSGRLREELGVLPPGDLRMALSSLCEDNKWGLTWRDAMQHRFKSSGDLDNHALGNLLIVTMWELLGDTVEGLDWVAQLLGCQGRVLPQCGEPLEISARVLRDGVEEVIRGQSKVAKCYAEVLDVQIDPPQPRICAQTIEAITEAEGIVLGPGSWYTSVVTHLLIPQLRQALVESQARKVLVMNLSSDDGETDGMAAADHLAQVRKYGQDLKFDVVIADPGAIDNPDTLIEAAAELGAKVVFRQVRCGAARGKHDPLRLAASLRDAFEGFLSEVGHPET